MMNTAAGVCFEKLPFRCHNLERRTVCTSKQSGSRWQVSILDYQHDVNHYGFIFKTMIKTICNPRYHLWTSIELSDSRCSLDCHPIGSPSLVHRYLHHFQRFDISQESKKLSIMGSGLQILSKTALPVVILDCSSVSPEFVRLVFLLILVLVLM